MSVRQRAKAYEAAVANVSPTQTRKISGDHSQAVRDVEHIGASTPVAPPRKSRKRTNTNPGSPKTERKENDPKLAQSAPKECTKSATKGKKPQRPPPPTFSGDLQDKKVQTSHEKVASAAKKPKPRLPPKPKHLLETSRRPAKTVTNGLASGELKASKKNVCSGEEKDSEIKAELAQNTAVVNCEIACCGIDKDQEIVKSRSQMIVKTKSERDTCDRSENYDGNSLEGMVVSDASKNDETTNSMDLTGGTQMNESICDVKEESKMDDSVKEVEISGLTDKAGIQELEIISEVGGAPQQGAQSGNELTKEKEVETRCQEEYISTVVVDISVEAPGTDYSSIAVDEHEKTFTIHSTGDTGNLVKHNPVAGVSSGDEYYKNEDLGNSDGRGKVSVITSECAPENAKEDSGYIASEQMDDTEQRHVSTTSSVDETATNQALMHEKEHTCLDPAEQNEEGHNGLEREQYESCDAEAELENILPEGELHADHDTGSQDKVLDESSYVGLCPTEAISKDIDVDVIFDNETIQQQKIDIRHLLPEQSEERDTVLDAEVSTGGQEEMANAEFGATGQDEERETVLDADISTGQDMANAALGATGQDEERDTVLNAEVSTGGQEELTNTAFGATEQYEERGTALDAEVSTGEPEELTNTAFGATEQDEERGTALDAEVSTGGQEEMASAEFGAAEQDEERGTVLDAVISTGGQEELANAEFGATGQDEERGTVLDAEVSTGEQEEMVNAEFGATGQDEERGTVLDTEVSTGEQEMANAEFGATIKDEERETVLNADKCTEQELADAGMGRSVTEEQHIEADVKSSLSAGEETESDVKLQVTVERDGEDSHEEQYGELMKESEGSEEGNRSTDPSQEGNHVDIQVTVGRTSDGELVESPQGEFQYEDMTKSHVQQVTDENTNPDQLEEDSGSCDPARPGRPNRAMKLQKHVYEEVRLPSANQTQEDLYVVPRTQLPAELRSSSCLESKSQSQARQSDYNESVEYDVPSSVLTTTSKPEANYSVPRTPLSEGPQDIVQDCEYDVPKTSNVSRASVADLDQEMYAVPSPVVKTIPLEESQATTEYVYSVPQDHSNGDSSALDQKPVPGDAVIPLVSSSSKKRPAPPKPPRSSSLKGNMTPVDKRVEAEKENEATNPKPFPRTQGVGIANGSPTPKPRSSSPSVAVRSEKEGDHVSGSPVLRPRSQPLSIDARPLTPVLKKRTEPAEKPETDEEGLQRKAPPPRPPPPSAEKRACTLPPLDLTACAQEGRSQTSYSAPGPPLSPGLEEYLGASSESDSDGEESKPKEPDGPSKPKIYHIAHEILSTEQTFVNALKLVFEDCYGTIKSAAVIPEFVLNDIFKDLENIFLLDAKFLQELEARMTTWEDHQRIGDVIKKYSYFLKMYTQYVNGYDKAMAVFQDTMNQNPRFARLVRQFQASESCQGLQLNSFMLKPVQRIPSYRLLLIDYLKHLPDNSEEHEDIDVALKIVSEVAKHINDSMKKMDSFEQILKIQSRLIGHPEIVKAGRDFIKEGVLSKLCRKDLQPRMFFLLTDVLLYCTSIGAGNQFKLVKKLPLLGMKVTAPDSPDFVNEFSIISTTRSFTLTASTPEERDEWLQALNEAINVVTERKKTFLSEMGKDKDAIQLVDDSRLGQTAPVWIPDARATMCMLCTVAFTVTNRRHHCRACGRVVCNLCSDNVAPLVYLDYNQARVCDKCYETLLKDFHKDDMATDAEPVTPPLLQESEEALEKLHRKPTKFEMMTRFKSRRRKRHSKIIRPSVLTEVVGAQEGSQTSGYLRYKKGGKGWKRMWFVLKDRVLYTYKASSDVVAHDSLPVLGYEVEGTNKDNEEFAFQLKHRGVAPIMFKAENESSKSRWIEELKQATRLV